jgi:hypothetical protein
MNNNNNEDMSDEDLEKGSEAYLMFVHRFSEYIKEMDRELWHKAREYAQDFTKIDGVTIELIDDDEEDTDDRDDAKRGSD